MVRQHDPARADANRFGATGDVSDHDRRRGARDAGQVVMFRQPIAVVAPLFRVLREVERVAEREARVAALYDGRKIEQRKMFHASH